MVTLQQIDNDNNIWSIPIPKLSDPKKASSTQNLKDDATDKEKVTKSGPSPPSLLIIRGGFGRGF